MIKEISKDPKIYGIKLNSLEVGVLMAVIWRSPNRQHLIEIFEQLRVVYQDLLDDARVEITKLADGNIMMKSSQEGWVVTRDPYEWEVEHG